MIKHLFSDMDGTLLNAQGVVSAATVAAVRACHLPLTLVSARAPMEMAAAIDALGLTGAQVGFNGGLIFRRDGAGWQTLSERVIAPDLARRLLEELALKLPRLSVSYYDRDRWYSSRSDAGIDYESRLTGLRPVIQPVAASFAQPDFKVFKIMLVTFDEAEMEAAQALLKRLAPAGVSIQRSGQAYLEITSAAAKKSRGLAYVMAEAGLQPAETAAFGDGHNDLPMLEAVGLPIVMANALPEIKAIAAYVTGANTEDGVAQALRRLPALRPS